MIPEFNSSSPQHMSLLLFGGCIKTDVIEPIIENEQPVVFKTGKNKGQIKTRKVKSSLKINGLGLIPNKEWATKKEGIYSTDDKVLKTIENYQDIPDATQVAGIVLRIRELTKQISTYYNSVEELIYDDSLIRAQFNHVTTDTSRLGCKNPNIQNQPTGYSKVKEHFISRYNNGVLVSADYKQLEICIQAQLSKDSNFMEDIKKGIDFHIKRLAAKESKNYDDVYQLFKEGDPETIAARSLTKGFSFARAYGAGQKKISDSTGMTMEEVMTLIRNEDILYPGLKKFNDINQYVVEKQGWYKDPWGRRYAFRKYATDRPWHRRQGLTEAYNPTEIKNYIVQGFATGNIVLVMLGKFWRNKAIFNRDKYLLINTVHDSIILDCKESFIEEAKKDLLILEECAIISKNIFNYEFKVPINIDIKVGKTWLDC